MAASRCAAADAASRADQEIARDDADEISAFGLAIDDFRSRVLHLRDNARSAAVEAGTRSASLARRMRFHVDVALNGVQRAFTSGFADAFDDVRERSLLPLVADCYETMADIERTVKQISYTSASETVARKVC